MPAKTKPVINWKLIHADARKNARVYLQRISAVTTNGPRTLSDEMLARLFGAEQALNETLHEQNHLAHWLDVEEKKIIDLHKTVRENCGCGVCRRSR